MVAKETLAALIPTFNNLFKKSKVYFLGSLIQRKNNFQSVLIRKDVTKCFSFIIVNMRHISPLRHPNTSNSIESFSKREWSILPTVFRQVHEINLFSQNFGCYCLARRRVNIRDWLCLTLLIIENVTVKKTFAGTDQTTWNRVKLWYFDRPVPVFIRFIEISRIYRNIYGIK